MSEPPSPRFPAIDLAALVRGAGVDPDAARDGLRALYDDGDARNARNTATLALPCRRGCDACCHESVFLTPLEVLVAWDWAQASLDASTRDDIVARALAIHAKERDRIEALDGPVPPGARDHLAIARELRFRCPFLGEAGECRIHPVRELYARLFGCSFNDEGGVYGCELVGAHLGGKTVTLVSVRRAVSRLAELPLTGKRQVYPYYFDLLYGAGPRPAL